MSKRLYVIGLGILAVAATGCETARPNARSFSYIRADSASRGEAFAAATEAMRERFLIERSDPEAGVVVAVPEESEEVGAGSRVGDAVGVPRRVRRAAMMRVTGSERSAELWCKVVIERNATEEQRMFSADRGIDDLPTGTAADRDGATTVEQNTVWRATRRDKVTERSLLRAADEILQRRRSAETP